MNQIFDDSSTADYYYSPSIQNYLKGKSLPLPSEPLIFLYEKEIDAGKKINFHIWGDYIFVGGDRGWTVDYLSKTAQLNDEEFNKIIKEIKIGKTFTSKVMKTVENPNYRYQYYWDKNKQEPKYINQEFEDSYEAGYNHSSRLKDYKAWLYLPLTILDAEDREFNIAIKFKQDFESGTAKFANNGANLTVDFYGYQCNWHILINNDHYYGWRNFKYVISGKLLDSLDVFWHHWLNCQLIDNVPTKGIKAAESKKEIKENLDKLMQQEPLLYKFYQWLHDEKTVGGITNNSLLSAMILSTGKDYDALVKELRKTINFVSSKDFQPKNYYLNEIKRKICLTFSAAKEKDEKRREHAEWYLCKSNKEKALGLGVDENKHPLLLKAIGEGDIPLNVFHNPGNQLQLVNAEFDIWEKALNREGWPEVISEIAKDVSRRSTYDKNITPYLSFLFLIEKYLDKHTKDTNQALSWKAMPKYVDSQWELEMVEAEQGQTSKRRSALTPVADNETKTITVPYAGIAIGGRQTTYCYSSHYYVFQENMIDPESNSVITRDLEEKLNGRDDYGLMFYTLDGTARNQGYPTFLVIFERRTAGTFVHFHRVHPNRTKNGINTPACRLVEECYRYMAGNVRAEEIAAQQGDLIFIKDENHKPGELKAVAEFESHKFVSQGDNPVMLEANTSTSVKNRLGFVYCDSGFELQHPEHEWLKLESGWYEVRRCKSFEANPQAVWSYVVD